MNARSLCALVLLAIACDGGDVPAPKPGGGRVDAVVAKAPKIDIEGFCDDARARGQRPRDGHARARRRRAGQGRRLALDQRLGHVV
ncbi:MAG: hypothetical protein U0168_30575 [Nannocystaceae bacterium]